MHKKKTCSLFIGASLLFAFQIAGAEDRQGTDQCGSCSRLETAIVSLRTEMKENMTKQLKGQQLIQEMAWKTERMRSLTTMLEGINEEIESKRNLLDAELEAKAQKFQPPTEAPELPSPAGLQENIDKFRAEITDAQSRKASVIGEISECESQLSKLSSKLTQIEDEIRAK